MSKVDTGWELTDNHCGVWKYGIITFHKNIGILAGKHYPTGTQGYFICVAILVDEGTKILL